MSLIDNPDDIRQSLDDILRRLHDVERQSPLGRSSVSRGVLKVLTPEGGELAGAGHVGGKSGLILKLGDSWVTVQEHVAAEVAAGVAPVESRVDAVEGRLSSAESRLTSVEGVADSAQSAANAAQSTADTAVSKANTAQGTADSAKAATDNHGPRIATLEGDIVGKASQADHDLLRQDFENLRNNYYNHTEHPPPKTTG